MKRIAIILFALTSGVVFAALWKYDNKKPPPITLPDAYQMAATALGNATNDFHCVRADFIGAHCPPGAWFFTFYNTNGAVKTVSAGKGCPPVVIDGRPDF